MDYNLDFVANCVHELDSWHLSWLFKVIALLVFLEYLFGDALCQCLYTAQGFAC